MPSPLTRRDFTKFALTGGACASFSSVLSRPARAVPASNKLNIACVGAAGKGWDDMIGVSGEGALHNIVAICDIDHRDGGIQPGNLAPVQLARPLGIGAARKKFPRAKLYSDFRKMLEQRDIDAVTVSTPDHMHATVALSAMALGKHVFVQKPLTQTVHEARILREAARAKGLITQMGNQHHSGAGYRCAVKMIQDGVIGRVRHAYSTVSARPVWPLDIKTASDVESPPPDVDWDLWLGVGKVRPYRPHAYHNFNWRAWKEYGTGMLGDLGCHVMDSVVWSLDLGAPRTVRAQVSNVDPEVYPEWSIVEYEFAGTKYAVDGFRLTWTDGRKPAIDPSHLFEGMPVPGGGSLLIGEKGAMAVSSGSAPRLYPQTAFRDYSVTTLKEMFAAFAAEKRDHYKMWPDAILAGKEANSPFEYAGHLTETVMLGTIAQRIPDRVLHWNAASLAFDEREATALVRRQYRKGWEIGALVSNQFRS